MPNGYPINGKFPEVSPPDPLPTHAMPAPSAHTPMHSAPQLGPAPVSGGPLFSTSPQTGVHQPYYPDPACLNEPAAAPTAAAPNPYSGNAGAPTFQVPSSPVSSPSGYNCFGVAAVTGPGYHLPGEGASPGHRPVPTSPNIQLPHVQSSYASEEAGALCHSNFYPDPTPLQFSSNSTQEVTMPSQAYPAISHGGIPTRASEVHSFSPAGFPGGMVSLSSVFHAL